MATEEPLPKDFDAQSRRRYDAIPQPESTFAQFLEADKGEYRRLRALEQNPRTRFPQPPSPLMTPCGNGDFPTSIDPTEWDGGWGSIDATGEPDFANFTAGLSAGAISSSLAHQTWVSPGADPNVPALQRTAPGSTGAARIGNMVALGGTELLQKTLTVNPSLTQMNFWYAVVLQNPPGHGGTRAPSFWVRVLDAAGNYLPNLADLGYGSDKIIATEPFLQTFVPSPGAAPIRYSDWRCARIDLSGQVGQSVTIQFVTEDCGYVGGMHYGYAYIDRFCGTCASPTGTLELDTKASSRCGKGKVCFAFAVPQIDGPTGPITGTVTISVDIYQNGVLLTTLPGPTLTSGTSYCVDVDPSIISGINPLLGGFDFVGRGVFTLPGTTIPPKLVGTVPNGQTAGKNNDYAIVCPWCCPGTNLVTNGNFQAGTNGFTSQYAFNANVALGATVPGSYNVVTELQAATISPLWVATDHYQCKGGIGPVGRFMVVNGRTCQSGSKVIWSETVPVAPGKEHRFCAYFKNFRQTTFDILPKVEVKFSGVPSANIGPTVVNTSTNPCDWQLVSGTVVVPSGGPTSLTIEIWLDETGIGDGNDLAIDDISFQLKSAMNPDNLLVSLTTTNIAGNFYTVTATYPPALPPTTGYFWEVCELPASGGSVCVTPTNPPQWWTYPAACQFNGYPGTGTTLSGPLNSPGKFEKGKRYRIRFGVWSDCEAWAEATWTFQYDPTTRAVKVTRVEAPSPATPISRTGAAGVPHSGGCC